MKRVVGCLVLVFEFVFNFLVLCQTALKCILLTFFPFCKSFFLQNFNVDVVTKQIVLLVTDYLVKLVCS